MIPLPPDQGIRRRARHGFTLVELLVAFAVFAVMMVLMASSINQMSFAIKVSSNKVEAFAGARTGMESVTRLLGSATLNTYWDYFDSSFNTVSNNANFVPAYYGRQSDLAFLITNASGTLLTSLSGSGLAPVSQAAFFYSILGYATNTGTTPPSTLNSTLNPCGFFIAYGNDPSQNPIDAAFTTLNNKPRFRLYQWLASTERADGVTSDTGKVAATRNWIAPSTNTVSPVAENIIAFVLRVPDTNAASSAIGTLIATNYNWDSTPVWNTGTQPNAMNQLPPFVTVTMIAVDEKAVNRLAGTATDITTAVSRMGISAPGGTPFANLFTSASSFTNDLANLKAGLDASHISYRVFETTVQLPGSKWSP